MDSDISVQHTWIARIGAEIVIPKSAIVEIERAEMMRWSRVSCHTGEHVSVGEITWCDSVRVMHGGRLIAGRHKSTIEWDNKGPMTWLRGNGLSFLGRFSGPYHISRCMYCIVNNGTKYKTITFGITIASQNLSSNALRGTGSKGLPPLRLAS